MTAKTTERYDFALLERLIVPSNMRDEDGPSALVAQRLGVPRRTVHRLRQRGLTLTEADELATAANYHPWNVWDQWDIHVDQLATCRLCGDALPTGEPVRYWPAGSKLVRQEERIHDRHRRDEWWARLDRYRTQSTTTSEVAC